MNNMYANNHNMANNHMEMNASPSDHLLTGGANALLTGGSNLMDALLGGGAVSNAISQAQPAFSSIMARRDNHDDPTQDLGGGTNEAYEDGYGQTGDTPMSDPDWDDPEGYNEYDPPIHGDPVDEYDPNDFDWPEFDIPEWDIPGIPDQNFEFEDFPNEAPDFPEFEKAKRKQIPMGFYDAGSAAAGFSAGDLNVNPEDFLAAQVAQEAGVTHPLKQALLGR